MLVVSMKYGLYVINLDNHDDKLLVVYDGDSPADYPVDNNHFSFSLPPGYDG